MRSSSDSLFPSVRRRLCAGWAALAIVLSAAPVTFADKEAAQEFLKLGRNAIFKRQYDEAVERFTKALEEDPELIEAQYWLANALDKKNDTAGAIVAYRRYLSLFRKKKDASREETRLEKLADRRLSVIAKGGRELEDLDEEFAREIMRYARSWHGKDAAAALKALRLLLGILPENEDARELFERYGGTLDGMGGGGSGEPEAFSRVRKWRDLVEMKDFGDPPGFKHEGKELVVEAKQGKIQFPRMTFQSSAYYAIEMECLLEEEFNRGWLMGIAFGSGADDCILAILLNASLDLAENRQGRPHNLAQANMPPLDMTRPHKIAIVVQGNTIEVYLDGTRQIRFEHPERSNFNGDIGIFQQGCRARYTSMRFGKLQ